MDGGHIIYFRVLTIMEFEAYVLAFAPPPAHQRVHKLRLALCTDPPVYDKTA